MKERKKTKNKKNPKKTSTCIDLPADMHLLWEKLRLIADGGVDALPAVVIISNSGRRWWPLSWGHTKHLEATLQSALQHRHPKQPPRNRKAHTATGAACADVHDAAKNKTPQQRNSQPPCLHPRCRGFSCCDNTSTHNGMSFRMKSSPPGQCASIRMAFIDCSSAAPQNPRAHLHSQQAKPQTHLAMAGFPDTTTVAADECHK